MSSLLSARLPPNHVAQSDSEFLLQDVGTKEKPSDWGLQAEGRLWAA